MSEGRLKKLNFTKIKNLSQGLRNNMTDSERLLWEKLRGRKLRGYKFLRQHPLLYNGNLLRYNFFIADFYCAEKRAVIELDGAIHDKSEEYDTFRDSELRARGLHILRIKNDELKNMIAVLLKIETFLNQIS